MTGGKVKRRNNSQQAGDQRQTFHSVFRPVQPVADCQHQQPGNAVTGAGERQPHCQKQHGLCGTPPGARFTPCQHLCRNRHRPGYDLTFSAPKSVSMMAMLGGDKRLIDAHNQAVDFAVRQVEALASTRVMTDGQSETVLTGNLVMALFNHDTSRDQEPQLHTHAVVANVTQHNGEWKTLSSDKVGKTGFIENVYANQIAFGRLYREKL
ncbi:conjugative relaxase, partial [Escherichia coli]|nr:conjugative relaxase [Escherichia coli]